VRGLTPPGGASSWREAVARSRQPAGALLERLIGVRMALVRADQYQSFLSNPDQLGRNRTVYVYATAAAAAERASGSSGSSSRGGLLVALLAVGGSLLAAGAALVAWAHS
jgi:hypothetical protein